MGAIGATLFFTHFGNQMVGAKEPVAVAVRPDATATLAAAAVGADKKPETESKPESGTGIFKGTVTFDGKPPSPKVIVTKDDPKVKEEYRAVCAAEEHFSEELLINKEAGNGVANVVIYLRKAPEGYKAPPVPKDPVILDQKACHFIPHVLVIRCEQKLIIKSDDPITHNTHITPLRNSGFNQAISPSNRDGVEFVYKKPEGVPIPVTCDFHNWMKAHQLPLDHPFAAVTDENGRFEIRGLPPGKHTFYVWHEIPGYLNNKLAVEIAADKVKEEKLSFTAAQFKVGK